MENRILGLHHITAIAGNANRNHDFYTKVLGLRLVKKTVNFDDPGTYHFYFGDEAGSPGTILTFFHWEGIQKGKTGAGMATNIGYSVPAGSLDFWTDRFKRFNVQHEELNERFGQKYLSFQDPDGLKFDLIEGLNDNRKGWETSEVTADTATKGFHDVTLTVRKLDRTANILVDLFGYKAVQQEGNRHRFITDAVDNASIVDIIEAPQLEFGINAAGTNHHVAFRVKNDDVLMEFRGKIASKGLNITPKIDRDYFFSLYFREPNGILFELATDNPGFTRDEPLSELGKSLKLPAQYEGQRKEIEESLPVLQD
ncbi:MAG: ring-cleaving dioxygenase [Sphingobacteriales bacterium]|nr:ring-cleaving dioxygenase [Sphingobacteriales bacterium]